jgi:hypothetical protein
MKDPKLIEAAGVSVQKSPEPVLNAGWGIARWKSSSSRRMTMEIRRKILRSLTVRIRKEVYN